MIKLVVPKDNVSDVAYRVVHVYVASGARVSEGDLLLALETSKAVIDVAAELSGYVYLRPGLKLGDRVEVGLLVAVISDSPISDPDTAFLDSASSSAVPEGVEGGPTISREAQRLIEQHGIPLSAFAGKAFVRKEDVLALVQPAPAAPAVVPPPDPPELARVREVLAVARASLRARFQRHVPLGTLLGDRWQLAAELGMGKGASVYDEVCWFGDVEVGENTWVGPFCILDGARAPLRIGRNCSIGAGVHIYTHDTIQWALTGGAAPPLIAPTTIGDHCFIAPHSVIAPGTSIGRSCFVAAGSYVQGRFPDHSMIQGSPARIVGRVVFKDGHASFHRHPEE